jgi:chorismate synthase
MGVSSEYEIAIHPLGNQTEYEACVELQRATWGDDFREVVGPGLLQIAQKVGGIAAGAFIDERLVGFVFGLTGVRDGALVHWSHMLAVAELHRDHGIGRRLKAYQRAQLTALGVRRMQWTYDPLVARNAHLNLERLGARVLEYVPDMYGDSPMSRTSGVIGTDRFVVEWDLAEPPVGSGAGRAGSPDLPLVGAPDDPLPDAASVRVAIPDDIQALKDEDPAAARAWRANTRRAFQHYLGNHYVVAAFHREAGPLAWYRLDQRP